MLLFHSLSALHDKSRTRTRSTVERLNHDHHLTAKQKKQGSHHQTLTLKSSNNAASSNNAEGQYSSDLNQTILSLSQFHFFNKCNTLYQKMDHAMWFTVVISFIFVSYPVIVVHTEQFIVLLDSFSSTNTIHYIKNGLCHVVHCCDEFNFSLFVNFTIIVLQTVANPGGPIDHGPPIQFS